MPAHRIYLAPGASGNPRQLGPHAAGLRERGYEIELVALPKTAAERAVTAYRAAIEGAPAPFGTRGPSFGGRRIIRPPPRGGKVYRVSVRYFSKSAFWRVVFGISWPRMNRSASSPLWA